MNSLEPYILAYENEVMKGESNLNNGERGKPFNLQEIAAGIGNVNENGQSKTK